MKHRGTFHGLARARAWAGAAALAAATLAGPAAGAEALRVCADPDNLPFTKADGPERGLYIELAELIAKQMGVAAEYTWYHTGNERRALRNTILAKSCDAVFALPTDYRARGINKSQPFLAVGYAVVTGPDFTFKGLDDLKGKRVAVLFSTTPHIVLNTIEGFTTRTYKDEGAAFAALAQGEVDAAFLWGPSAGYENRKRHGERWRVTPVSGHDMAGTVSIGVRADMPALQQAIDQALAALKPQIVQLAEKYAFPRSKPVDIAMAGAPLRPPASAAVVVPQRLVVKVNDSQKPDAAAVAAGRVRFNDQCSHCHGADGYSPVRERDLRRLNMRYDAKWPEVALTTIRNGRNEQGMPPWKDILKEHEVQQLMGFLSTIQK